MSTTAEQEELLERVREASRALVAANEALMSAARRAHAGGVSWRRIGAALGVTRQAAWERFGKTGD